MFTQVRPFNRAQGGTTPNMCLANVTRGYGIPNRYASAWEAWQNTQQHGGEPPAGLDVPVFFSYVATIDGVNKNWGHIGVRLANGQFWSDGNIYSSISVYMVNHWPRYVGWGESVNGVKVIQDQPQGDPDMIPDQDNYYWRYGQKTAQAIRGRQLSREEFSKNIAGVTGTKALEILEDNPEADQAAADLKLGQLARHDNWQGQIYGLLDQLKGRPTPEQLAAAVKQAQDLQATVITAQQAADQAKADAEAARKQTSELEAEKAAEEQTGNLFMRWIGSVLNKLKGNG